MRLLFLGVLCIAAAFSGGCVFWDIRDEVRNTNARLDKVESRLEGTNAALDQTNAELKTVQEGLERLDRTNELIGGVETGLTRLDSTNSALSTMEERLVLLRSIEESLGRLDVHMASLRKTIGRIDGMIPFLDLGSDEPVDAVETADASERPVEPASGAVGAQEVGQKPGDQAQTGEAGAKEPTKAAPSRPARRDALLGAWVSEFPDRTVALVILDEGRFVRQSPEAAGVSEPAARTISGTWKRDGTSLELMPEALAPAAPAPGQPAQGRPAAPTVERYEIVAQTTRSLTLRTAAGTLLILGKP